MYDQEGMCCGFFMLKVASTSLSLLCFKMFPQQVEVHLLRRGFSQSVRSLSYLISPQRTVASIPSVQSPSSSPSIHTSSEEMNDHDQRPIKSIIPSSSPSSSAFHGTDGQQESAVVVMESEDGGSSNDSAISTIQIDRTDINSISNSSESSLLPSSSSTTPTNADGSDDAVSTATPTSFQLNYSTMERIEQQGDELAWKCIENLGDRIVAELSSHKTFFTPLVRNDPPTTPSLSLSPVSQQSVSDQLTIVLIDQIRTVSLLRLQQLLNLIESILLYADIEPHNNTTVNTSNTIASPAPSPPPTTVNSNPFVWSSLYDTIANPHGFDYTKKNTCISWWLHLVSKAKQLDPPIQSANSALEQMPAKL